MSRKSSGVAERVLLGTKLDVRLKLAMDATPYTLQDIVAAGVAEWLKLGTAERAISIEAIRELDENGHLSLEDLLKVR